MPTIEKKTCKDSIYDVLSRYSHLTPEEIKDTYRTITGEIMPYSINNICTRLSEMALDGYRTFTGKKIYLRGENRFKKNYKEWWIDNGELF